MLGKQGWHFLAHPDSLVTSVFKANYFSLGDFLEAVEGSNSSFVWRSILQSQIVLKHGCRWRVGNGAKIKVWHDPWFNDSDNFYVDSFIVPGCEDLLVKDLMDIEGRNWNFELLHGLFQQRDVAAISSIPISSFGREDIWIWHYAKKGLYIVKSANHVARAVLRDQRNFSTPVCWLKLWKLLISPKLKNFIWRTCRDLLPSRLRLNQRDLQVDQTCVLCGQEEDSVHALLKCPLAIDCWKLIGVDYSRIVYAEFRSWFFSLFQQSNSKCIAKFCAMAWSLWGSRNQLI
ncbi:hypothetical protein P3X46_006206 [Hevea brasiliensis]|uniref:Reverse transcriptase zinc-binding domain-containing protein n=1 Tax=Hevea brasiliensis TaxID=3981 RepID=A0ABQ9MTC1_HEVBR|nr:hypothetical protein P3X46_006206 [Hevea brasiliensis]